MRHAKVTELRHGFTLIEMLIVIVVIAIMALIVIPRVQSARQQTREATFRENLRQLRTALAAFETDTGIYPADLRDLVADDATSVVTQLRPGTYKGPYLSPNGGVGGIGIPINPFAPTSGTATVETHWTYQAGSGLVHSGVSGTTLDGYELTDL